MIVKTVTVSSKGQVSLPVAALRAMGVEKGTELLLVQEAGRLVLVKASDAGQRVVDELGGWESLATGAFEDTWAGPENDVWDHFQPEPAAAKAPRRRSK